jgi:hypothetical protein
MNYDTPVAAYIALVAFLLVLVVAGAFFGA